MAKKAEDVDAELAALHVPSHNLPNEPTFKPSSTTTAPQPRAARHTGDAAAVSKAQRLRERIKPFPLAQDKPGYQAYLEGLERRKARELRRTLRTVEAAKRQRQYRMIALAALLVVALALGLMLVSKMR